MGNKLHFFRQSSGGGGDAFIATFRTTTANESITLPYLNTGTYSGTIDWGDGTVVANSYANITHTYAVAGDYDVTILGDCIGFFAQNYQKIVNIKQWGNGFRLIDNISFGGYFYNTQNLDITANDTLDLTGITILNSMFYQNFNLVFNDSINNWDVSNVTAMYRMFADANNFNQPLDNWDISNVTAISRMFAGADNFNQDISSWDFSGLNDVNSLKTFMLGKSSANYNAEYYDNLLIKWASDPSQGGLQPNIIGTIDMGSIKYTANGAAARASILANNKAQTINDGGQV